MHISSDLYIQVLIELKAAEETIERVRKLANKFEQEPKEEMLSYHLAAKRIFTEINKSK